MRRIFVTAFVIVAAAGGAILAAGSRSDNADGKTYWVQLDNAFGLVKGADLKVGGVKAGRIAGFAIDRRARKAKVKIDVTEPGFNSFRSDVFCESKPQSLIGEYFLDCQPGKARKEIPDGGTIPVARTASTIPPDLVNNILRLPYRQRLRIILMELGAGVAGRAGDLNEAIRRAVPALRETDRVLAMLAEQNQTLKQLITNGDTVITALAKGRSEVGRFVTEANDASTASAERAADISATWNRFPGFLRELRPTMAALGDVADEQTPALRNLSAAAPQLERFFGNLGPFSDASRPAVRTLGDASVAGRRTIRSIGPTIDLLRSFSLKTPELAKNLAIVLEWLDSRDHAVEKDPRSPGGQGYTGLEALLQYVFDQSQAINVFDQNGFLLKASLFTSQECGPYADAKAVKEKPSLLKDCSGVIGPNQPGITTPDVGTKPIGGSDLPPLTDTPATARTAPDKRTPADGKPRVPVSRPTKDKGKRTPARRPASRPTTGGGGATKPGPASGGGGAKTPPLPAKEVEQIVQQVLDGKLPPSALPPQVQNLPGLQGIAGQPTGGQGGGRQGNDQILDYLLGP
jgi:phospholipid/cholesterol/gamma-HCH transport system substrate-binding protein